jgi:hypothetical protein
MPEVDLLDRRFDPRFFRERRLSTDPPGGVPQPVDVDTAPAVVALRENYRKVATKAEKILGEAVRLATVRRIPVEDSPEIAAAVTRQDPDSQGKFISFDLYRRAYEYLQAREHALPIEILDELHGDPTTDRRRISRQLRVTVDGISVEAADLLGDQIVTLFVLKLLQLGMDAMSDGAQSATKQPSGTEAAVIALQLATSIAAQQIYAGINQAQAEQSLEELNAGVPIPQANLAAARKSLAESSLFQSALLQRRPSDFQLIYSYAEAFLERQTAAGWETWQLAPELRGAVTRTRETATMLDRYPVRANTRAAEEPTDTLNLTTQLLSADIQISTGTPVTPSPEVMSLYERDLRGLNRKVDELGYVLGDTLDVNDLCCFLKWATDIGARPLALIRRLLETAQNAVKRLNGTRGPTFSAQLSVSTLIHQRAMLLLQDLMATVLERVRTWFKTDTEKWQELFAGCKLIDELVEYLTLSLEQLEQALVSLLNRYLGYIEDQELRLGAKIDRTGNQKRLRVLMTTIDQFLAFGGAEGGICPDTPVEPVQLAAAVERLLTNLGPAVALPVGEGDPFSTLQSPPVRLSSGVTMPSPPGATAGQTTLDLARDLCRNGVVRQNLVPFPRG